MERKYYLRGLGIGIVMTAVIMGIALSGNHKMTDEEIIARAKELGMTEDAYLAELDDGEEQQEQNIEDTEPDGSKELPSADPEPENFQPKQNLPESSESAEPEEEPLEVAQPVEEEPVETGPDAQKAAPQDEPRTEPVKKDTNEMTRQDDKPSSSVKMERVTVVNGDGSYQVALKLKDAGVITSAETFDDFLCEKGYDKKLRTGSFQIPTDASDEQIARILTGQE